jgi:hypothetical protein
MSADHDVSQLEALSRRTRDKIDKYDVAQRKDAEYNKLQDRLSYIKRLLWEKSRDGKAGGTGGKEVPSR